MFDKLLIKKEKNKDVDLFQASTILIILACMFLYEVGFCNLKDIIVNNSYNFSLFRIVMYSVFGVLYYKFSGKFIEEAKKTFESKKKIIYTYIVFSVLFTIYKFFTESHYYVLALIIIAELNGLLFLLYLTKDYIKNIVLSIITLGFVFSISIEYYHVVDEKKHFLSALNVAVGNFDFKNGLTDEKFNNISFDLYSVNFAMNYFSEYSSFDMKKILENESIFSTPADYSVITYIPASIGINVARFLGGSIADIFIAGRIANVIAYGILLIIIFKLLPFKKDVFYVMYLLPMQIAIAGTYSADGITIGLVGIFIAYVFKLYKENYDNVSLKQFYILLFLFGMVLSCKKCSYFGIVMMIFILPLFKIIKNNKKILSLTIIILLIAGLLGIYHGSRIVADKNGDVRADNSSPSRQIEFLLQNPINILKVYGNYLKESLFNLNWYRGFNLRVFCGNIFTACTYGLFILVLYTAITDNSYIFSQKEKIIMCLAFGLVFFETSFVLYLTYTQVGKLTIGGYQARYLTAVVPLVLVGVNSKKISKDYINTDEYNKMALYLGVFSILDLISVICV